MRKDDMNQRVLLAVLISFVFIIVYSLIFQDPQKQKTSASNVASSTSNPATSNTNPTPNTQNLAQNLQNPHTNLTPSTPATNTTAPATKREIISTITSNGVEVQIDDLGRISQVYLKDKKFTAPKQEGIFTHLGRLFGLASTPNAPLEKLPLLSPNAVFPLEMRFEDAMLNIEATQTPYTASLKSISLDSSQNQILTLTQKLSTLTITKTIEFIYDEDGLKYKLDIALSTPKVYFLSSGSRPIADDDGYAFHGVVLKQGGINGVIEKIEDKDAKIEGQNFSQVPFVSASDRYFTTLLFTRNEGELNIQVLGTSDTKNPIPYIILASNTSLEGYVGPKDYRDLAKIYPVLTDVVEYGLITFFAKPVFLLLDWLYVLLGNWGWAIIGVTLVVRIILFPLSYKGIMSMQRLKDLTPKMKEIQEQYKGDPQKMQAQLMQLYKKHGANPLGGCLPIILQIPVFFAIYRVLYNAVELKNSEWIFWIHDLSVMDPYFILPILMGVSMYIQQILTPNTLDPMQARIFKLLPVIFTIFLITFPAGLVLYWTVNNIFAILMQIAINKIIDKQKAQAILEHKEHKTTKSTPKSTQGEKK